MRPAERFEQLWRRVSAGTPRAEMGPMPAEVAGSLETALALSRLSIVIEAPAIEDAWSRFAAELDVAEATPVPRLPSHRPVYVVRTFVAVAASFALVVTASLQARPGSALYGLRRTTEDAALVLSPSDTGLHLRLAGARLDDLVGALSDGNEARAPGLAVSLAAERSAAISGGADVSALDARIVAEVPPVLAGAPTDVVRAVTDALSAILPSGVVNGSGGDGTSGTGSPIGSHGGGSGTSSGGDSKDSSGTGDEGSSSGSGSGDTKTSDGGSSDGSSSDGSTSPSGSDGGGSDGSSGGSDGGTSPTPTPTGDGQATSTD